MLEKQNFDETNIWKKISKNNFDTNLGGFKILVIFKFTKKFKFLKNS